jgi:hypothetical protein
MFMKNTFDDYVVSLESLAHQAAAARTIDSQDKNVLTALDGGPRLALENIPRATRRKTGIFFTSSLLARKAIRSAIDKVDNATLFLDPACGAGDLLLTCAELLPIEKDLELTLHSWGERLTGYDLRNDFVRLAKARLFLAAVLRSGRAQHKELSYSDNWFPRLVQGNYLEKPSVLQATSTIVMNPPYHLVDAPKACKWATGKVSSAALFLDYCIDNAALNSRIVAILPDVLRSGSRYENWRNHILKNASIEKVNLWDRFDQTADIHVFILHLQVTKAASSRKKSWNNQSRGQKEKRIGDDFEVHVGAVVPYRDRKVGKIYPYLIAKDLPVWKTVADILPKRRFSGTVYQPPFVVVRRTSRPEDQHRAVGTIILGHIPVAVENHLLVLQPKDKTIETCKRLLANLQRPKTTDWLNRRIRCRHLTISSLAELPWWI